MTDKRENFFPNIYIREHGYQKEIEQKQIYFLTDGSGCISFYSSLSEEKNQEIEAVMKESGKIKGVQWYSGMKPDIIKPCAVFELKKGVCSEDIMDESEEKYADMKGLHGYHPEHVEEMNGFILVHDPKNKLIQKEENLRITDIRGMIEKFAEIGGKKDE